MVALSGWSQDEDKARSREAGFDHHLVKPVEPERLDALMQERGQRQAGDASSRSL
jgi:DNA-binding response OmpR family regulator